MHRSDSNGYSVIAKATKEVTDGRRHRNSRSAITVELAVDAIELAKHVDEMVLFSGDGDFRPLVEALQRRGVHVTVVSTILRKTPIAADELRKQADAFIDLAELRAKLSRHSE